MVLTGHIHVFSANRFSDTRPPEIIAGNSGAHLDAGPFPYEKDPKITKSMFRDFGYMTMEKTGEGQWTMLSHDIAGKVKVSCKVVETPKKKTDVSCQKTE